MKAKYYSGYHIDSCIAYMYKNNTKIRSIDLDNKINIEYSKLVYIGSNTTPSAEFKDNVFNSRRESVVH